MKSSMNDGDGAGSNDARRQAVNEPLFGDRRYVRQRLKALKDPRHSRRGEEVQAVREALNGWRWI